MRKPLLELGLLLSAFASSQSVALPVEIGGVDPTVTTTVHGNLTGSFVVNPMGAATYTIPLEVAIGTEGIIPRLSLVYNSLGGEDIAGYGWSLSGISAITKCPRLSTQGVSSSSANGLCLDGQRLILESGTYNADGSEYRTERNNFSKIVAHGSSAGLPTSFEIWDKAGSAPYISGIQRLIARIQNG